MELWFTTAVPQSCGGITGAETVVSPDGCCGVGVHGDDLDGFAVPQSGFAVVDSAFE